MNSTLAWPEMVWSSVMEQNFHLDSQSARKGKVCGACACAAIASARKAVRTARAGVSAGVPLEHGHEFEQGKSTSLATG